MGYNNEDEGNRLLGDFVSKFSRLTYLISDLIVTLSTKSKSAKETLEDEFNKLSQDNKSKNRKKANFQSLHDTIEINKDNTDCNLTVIIGNHFGHFGIILQCLRKQIQSMNLSPTLTKELSYLLNQLDEIAETRNDLLHSGIVATPEREGIGILRYRIEQSGVMTKKNTDGFLDQETEKIIKVGTALRKSIESIN